MTNVISAIQIGKKGRPSKYDSSYCDKVLELMSKGFSKQAVAGELGISRDTFYAWVKAHKDFSDTIKISEMRSLLFWENIGIDGMMGKITGFRPAVWIFVMKNRFGWKDNVSLTDELPESDFQDEDPVSSIRDIVREYGKTLNYPFPVKNVT